MVDTCSPLTDCVPTYPRLTLADSAPPNPVPAGALVRVHVLVEHPFGCAERLLVTNLASWGGLDNGVRQDEIVWLAAADGVETTLDEAPFTVEKVALHCAVESGQSYLLRFRLRDASLGDPGVDLGMGVEALWTPAGKAPLESWRVRNLRSYESGAQDDYWGYGYWLVQQPGLD